MTHMRDAACSSILKPSAWVLAGLLLLACSGAAAQAAAADARQARFDALFEQTMRRYHLPGLAVGVVQDGQVVYTRTAGELEAGKGRAIDADTLFKIASNSKAMTTGLLARLVDQGKLQWDDPVGKYLPDFRMHDPWVTAHIQVRDLLIHNSGLGLGAGDLMLWPEPNHFTRADIIGGLAHLKPTHSFRSHYAYDNLLYVVAGEVAAKAAGKPYEQLIREEVFAPLGMTRCQVGTWSRDGVGNVAQPHMQQGGRNIVVREDGAQIPDAPSMAAGGIRCSLRDMLTWIGMWLDTDAATPWISAAQRNAVWALQTPMPISQRMRDWDGTHLYGYGYGWRISDVDGQWKVAHTGTLMGMYSSLVMLPDKRTGFIILINGEGEGARTTLGQALAKSYTAPGRTELDVNHYADLLAASAAPAAQAAQAKPVPRRVPTKREAMTPWLGVYRDAWFGEVSVCAKGRGVNFHANKSPRLDGPVMQAEDRLLVDWSDPSVDAEPWLAFARDDEGAVTLKLAHVDPAADFSYDYADLDFVRIGDCPAR
jgi:CubicO group peptidase (beta-lactamase class C family)